MEDFYLNFAEAIKQFRKNQRKNQEKFAEEYNVSTRQVQRWEAGECIPDHYVLARFCGEGMDMNECYKKERTNENEEKNN